MTTLNLLMTLVSMLSICGCIMVILCLFRLDISKRNKAYNKIILGVVISDMFSAIGTSFGTNRNNTPQCTLQAFMTIAFPLCSIFWTTVSFYLFHLAVKNRFTSEHMMIYLNFICWGFPVILALLPLTVGLRYGVKEGSDREWCSLSNPNDIPDWQLTFWTFASFYFWLWLSVVGFSTIICFIFYELRSRIFFTNDETNARLQKIVNKMILLPMVIVICWTIPTCYRIYYYIKDDNVYVLQLLSAISASSKGFLTSILLFATETVQWKVRTKRESDMTQLYRNAGPDAAGVIVQTSSSSVASATSSLLYDSLLPSLQQRPTMQDEDDDDERRVYNIRASMDNEKSFRKSRNSANEII